MSNVGQNKFDQVFLEHYDMLHQFGLKISHDDYIAQECIQELFIYLHEKEIDLENVKYIKAYLLKSYRRRLLKKLKSNYKEETITDIHFRIQEFEILDEEEGKTKRKLITILNELPWSQREAIFLKFYNHLSAKEIAEIMNIKPQVVSNTICKTLKKIRMLLQQMPLLCFIGLHFI